MDTQTFINLGLVLVFVLVGGIFAATELALVSLRDSQLTAIERRSARGARVAAIARDPNRFLAAVQIGVTVAGFLSAAYGGSTLAPDVAPYFERLGMADTAAEPTALIVMTLAIAYLSLVFGELVPKRLALQKAEGVSLAVGPILDRFATLMRPVIWLLSVSTNAVVRLLGGDPHATSEQLSEEELRELVSTHDDLDEQERAILRDVFAATEKTLKEVMRPRRDVVFMAGTMRLSEAAAQIRDVPHSRYPVTGQNFDDVIGFLHVRDLLGRENDNRRVRDVCRPVPMLPGTRHVLPSVALMRKEGTHMAMVVDEYGGTDGIVTLEDLVEELVGDIRDEYDDPEPQAHTSTFDAGLSIEDFAEASGVALDDGDYETVAGYVIARLGRIPDVGDTVDIEGGVLEVAALEGHRVRAITLLPARPAIDDEESASPGGDTDAAK